MVVIILFIIAADDTIEERQDFISYVEDSDYVGKCDNALRSKTLN